MVESRRDIGEEILEGIRQLRRVICRTLSG